MLPTLEATNLEPAADGGYAISTWVAVPKPQRSSSSSGSFPTVPNQEKTEFRNPVETHSGCPFLTKNLGTSSGIFCFSQWVPWLVVVIGGLPTRPIGRPDLSLGKLWRNIWRKKRDWSNMIELFRCFFRLYYIIYIYMLYIYIYIYCIYVYIYMFWMLDNIHDSVTNWFLTHFLGFQCPLMHSKFLCLHDLLDHVHLSSQNACAHKQNMNYCQWQQATKP